MRSRLVFSVRISKEIVEFASGKDPEFQPERSAVRSDALSEEQARILEQRGVLSQEEIRQLAHKGRQDKLACHSDNESDSEKAADLRKVELSS